MFFLNSWIPEFLNSWIPEFLNSWIPELMNWWIDELMNWWIDEFGQTFWLVKRFVPKPPFAYLNPKNLKNRYNLQRFWSVFKITAAFYNVFLRFWIFMLIFTTVSKNCSKKQMAKMWLICFYTCFFAINDICYLCWNLWNNCKKQCF
jgi:hypothetical protein